MAAPGILGRKVGMTQLFEDDGTVVPVTVVEAGPCPVLQVKSSEGTDGYDAIQVGFSSIREKLVNKPELGHFTRAGEKPKRYVREFRVSDAGDYSVGQQITVSDFTAGDTVDVIGTSKGLGMQGGVRRYGFRGGPKSHGQSNRLRAPGSIGSSSTPSRVYKGTKMAGRMGNERVTVRNLRIADVDAERGLLLIRGAVPGRRGGLVMVRKTRRTIERETAAEVS
jgi:large subunit ribosomal protein L3